ncbi:putative phosphatidate phosphatase isoform X1 [Leptinotarsa decemlineata]|uniref:putative phosphatidate phosphatase isoform X1 n=1 Tax=Leptinotarsa decemlineata TaxID=7539 RepID=UPI003D304611
MVLANKGNYSSVNMPNRDETIQIKWQKCILDFILLNCVGWPILFLFLWGSPYKRGFFCDDESLRHPYIESTVPSWSLYLSGLGLNGVVMLITEYLLHRSSNTQRKVIFGREIPNFIYSVYCIIGIFAFGAACSQLTTDIMKYTIGRLRPHFFTVCQPDVCNGSFALYKYYENFTCTNELYKNNKRIMKEMRLSFPSGHSSFSMYCMTYLAIYLQKRMTWDASKLLKHTLQFLAVLWAVFTAMTRVSDYKHHWSDVLCGLGLGALVAIITARYFSTLFSQPEVKLEESVPINKNGNNITHNV